MRDYPPFHDNEPSILGGGLMQVSKSSNIKQAPLGGGATQPGASSPSQLLSALYTMLMETEQLIAQLQATSEQFRINVPMPSLPTQRAQAPTPATPQTAPPPPMSEIGNRVVQILQHVDVINQVLRATIQSFDI